ncbi:replication-relaxation family protein [Desulfosporosinus sp. OT]|uniref:replication-relaxation family protein n=1 Tax=Desulfosporosinus sp. OT TaxID=913865 RepID=UPI001FA71FDA|nr:replication-relaxation family protein [Desulfosporosinus sp. OT]
MLESQGALDTDQIQLLLFKDNVLHTTRRRLKKLVDVKKIKRDRISINEPYFYYLDKKPGQIEHVLGVSWIYTWVCTSLSNTMQLHSFEREVVHKTLRPDALICVKSLWSNSFSFFYGEFNIVESGHDFAEKVKRYNDFYSSGEYLKMWWVPLAQRFPIIRVVTTGRIDSLLKKITKENVNNLEFQVFSLEQVKEECLHGSSSSCGLRA